MDIGPWRDADGAGAGGVAVARDITDRTQQQSRVEGLLESAPDAIVVVDWGEIVLVNAQTEKLFGYPRKDLLGQEVEAPGPGPLP
jgi:PAS domain-containing protein